MATVAFIVFAVWNAFNDPLIGYTMEKTVFKWTRKKGFRRFPWYMIAIPFWLGSYFLIFLVPTQWDAVPESSQKWFVFVWYIVSICLYDLMFSLMDVNSLSIYPEKYKNPKSRKITQAFVAAFGILGLVLAFTIQPMFLPKDVPVVPEDYRRLAMIAAVIGLLIVIPTIPRTF